MRRCGVGVQDVHSQGEVIACLEKAVVREAEQQTQVIKDECKKAIMRVAELSSDDFHLDRHLYFSCREDRERLCENVRSPRLGGGWRRGRRSSDSCCLCCRSWPGRAASTSVSSTTSLRRSCRSA